MSLNDLLEAVAELPDEDQEMFVEIVCQRRIERRRAQLARDVAGARRQFRAGKCQVAAPREIMREVLS